MKKILQLSILIAIILSVTACSEQNPKGGLSVTKVTRDKVGEALTISGRWGTFINGKSYQQMPIETYKGWQYVTYYDPQRHVCIGRRKLPDGVWELIQFKDYLFEGNDNHNVTVLGISPGDGTIHLAFDHHLLTVVDVAGFGHVDRQRPASYRERRDIGRRFLFFDEKGRHGDRDDQDKHQTD